jgi:hypothetical protein
LFFNYFWENLYTMSLIGQATQGVYMFGTDITSVVKTSTGKVMFYKGTDVIVGITELKDLYLDADSGLIFFFTDRYGYSFSFYDLVDLNGRPYTVVPQGVDSLGEYIVKLRSVYEDLQAVFVGCCECGGGSSNVEFYANEAAFPATGEVDVLYVDKATPALYVWDGTAYDIIGGGSGGGVESVTGDSVDNTDPANPIVNAVPLSGTTTGNAVAGDVEFSDAVSLKSVSDSVKATLTLLDSDSYKYTITDGVTTVIYGMDLNPENNLTTILRTVNLKSRLWNKAGVPTTTDDVSQGYVANQSLILDTNTGILYKCTDNTAGAAVWEVYYDPSVISNNQLVPLSSANVTTTSATLVDITGLVTPTLPANTVWEFELFLATVCTGAGGIRFGFTSPDTATGTLYIEGTGTSLAAYQQSSTSGTISATGVTRFNGVATVKIVGRIVIGATPTTVKMQFASGTSGQTSTIAGNNASVMKLTKLA